ncbi:MAG: M1 family aminopeptidase [Sciscionella sp.]
MDTATTAVGADRGYRVTHYDVDLDYRVPSNRLSGRVRLRCVATKELVRFSLDLSGLRVVKLALNVPGGGRFGRRKNRLNVRPLRALAAAEEFTVDVHYTGKPRPMSGTAGPVGWHGHGDCVVVVSGPGGAATWLPCLDVPDAKATYRLALTVDPAYTVVACGELVESAGVLGEGRWVYQSVEPAAPAMTTIQIGRYETLPLAGRAEGRALLPAECKSGFLRDFARYEAMMAACEEYFGPYPFARHTVVVAPVGLNGPVVAQEVATFSSDLVSGRRECERFVMNALVRQWFGASLTLAAPRHAWLADGVARYAEWLWSERSGSTPMGALAARAQRQLAALPADLVLADPGRTADDRIGERGALLLHALRARLGDDAFFAALREFATSYRHATVASEDFIALSRSYSKAPLDEFWAAWLLERPVPML